MPHQDPLKSELLIDFFLHQLGRIFYGKKHLLSKLPHLLRIVQYKELAFAIAEMAEKVHRQMARIELIHALLEHPIRHEVSHSISGLLEDAYHDIELDENSFRPDIFVIHYLQLAEITEMAGFKLLQMVAVKLGNRQVKQLLQENYNDANAGRTLLLLIATNYIVK